MHLTIVAYGTWGDVRPSVALGLALKEAGYGVRLSVSKDFARWVENAGLEVHLLPVDKFEVMRQVSSETHPLRVIQAIHREIAPALLKSGAELLRVAEDTDALLVNEWLLGMASGIAEVHQLKLVNISTQPSIKTGQVPIATLPSLPDWAPGRESYNRLSYKWAHYLRWLTYGRQANWLRKKHLNLAPLSARAYLQLLERTPSITLISRHVMARPRDWHDQHHLTGYLFFDDEGWRPPAELEAFLHAGEAPVYVGFGSMHDRHPEETTGLILEALEQTGHRGVLYSGWADLGQGGLPDHVYRLDYAPHHWLFPRMRAIVHHAGAGTTAAALRAGVPSVPVPHSGDQPFWARKLYQIGAGTKPLPRNRLSAAGLAERMERAVQDPRLKRQAADLGARISAEDGADRTVAAIKALFHKNDKSLEL